MQAPIPTRQARVALAGLVTNPRNPNKMGAQAYAALVEAIRLRGPLQPLLVLERFVGGFDDEDGEHVEYEVVDGHHRRQAMLDLGYTAGDAVVLPHGTPREVVLMLSLGMNRLRGTVSIDAAEHVLRELLSEGADLDEMLTTGFTAEELNELLNPAPLPERSRADAPDENLLPDKPHVLELTFATEAQLKQATKRLRKAAGKTKNLGLGLLNLLGETT